MHDPVFPLIQEMGNQELKVPPVVTKVLSDPGESPKASLFAATCFLHITHFAGLHAIGFTP